MEGPKGIIEGRPAEVHGFRRQAVDILRGLPPSKQNSAGLRGSPFMPS